MAAKACPTCGLEHKKRGKYCCAFCYHAMPVSEDTRAKMSVASKGKPKSTETRARMSAAGTGKPKPWQRGERNVNFGNKVQGRPDVRARFLAASRVRGQAWTGEQRERHAERMRGPCNAMRGRKHTEETKARIATRKREQYCNGEIHFRHYKLSKAEREIAAYLKELGVVFKPQHHIDGIPYIYDFLFPEKNLIVEYQGDYWHANPRKYSPGTMLKIQNVGDVLVDSIWVRDAVKREAALQRGFEVVYIWEMDYKMAGSETIRRVLNAFGVPLTSTAF